MAQSGPIKGVRALSEYHLEVEMETGTIIDFDFGNRLTKLRFGALQEDAVFQSVRTDGNNLLFRRGTVDVVTIAAQEFMDMVLTDKSSER